MIRRGYIKAINDKIDKVLEYCKELNLEFDNQTPNKYMVKSKTIRTNNKVYLFTTYQDVINALELIKEVK